MPPDGRDHRAVGRSSSSTRSTWAAVGKNPTRTFEILVFALVKRPFLQFEVTAIILDANVLKMTFFIVD